MDFTVKKDSISVCESRTEASAEHTLQFCLNLPEYMPEIVKILRCTLLPSVTSRQINGDRVMAECDCEARLIYVCNEGNIHVFSSSEHFGKQLPVPEGSGEMNVCIKTEFVNYRAAGGRKVEINGAVLLSLQCLCKKEASFVCEASGGGITLKKSRVQAFVPVAFTGKSFTASETCEVNCNEHIGSVLSVSHYVRLDEQKSIHGKLFLKGELFVKTVALSESGNVLCFENSIVISQIIDVPEISEGSVCDVSLTAPCVTVRPRPESAGGRGLLDIEAELYATVKCFEQREIEAVCDAYSTKYNSEVKTVPICLYPTCDKLSDTFLCRESVDLSPVGAVRVLVFNCTDTVFSAEYSGGEVTLTGSVTAECIFEDSNGELCFSVRSVPFEYKHTGVGAESAALHLQAAATAYSYTLCAGGTLDVRIEIAVSGLILSESTLTAATEITLDKSAEKEGFSCPLTLYFAEPDESLWELARRFNTTEDAILRENSMQDSTLTQSTKLIIPKM